MAGYQVIGHPGLRVDTGNRYYHFNGLGTPTQVFYLVEVDGQKRYVPEDSWEYAESVRQGGIILMEYMRETRTQRRLEKSKARRAMAAANEIIYNYKTHKTCKSAKDAEGRG